MIYPILKELILTNVGKLKPSSKQWQTRNCMLCQSRGHGKDIRNRFGLKFENNSIVCNCFNCGFAAHWAEGELLSAPLKLLLKSIGADDNVIKFIDFEIYKHRHSIVSTQSTDTDIKYINLLTRWPAKTLPKDTLPISEWLHNGCEDENFLQVVDYMISRRLLSLDKFYWSPNEKQHINKRFIIPYYYRKNIVGFTARYAEDLKEKTIPKYYQSCPENFVYNLDPQDDWRRKYVILTEGVLDAWVVDGCGILGEINQDKIDTINRLQKDIIVCPDRDKKGKDLVNAAINNGWAVSFPKWDSSIKDAAQASEKYGKLLTLHSIINSAVYDKTSIKLKWEFQFNEMSQIRK